MSEARAVTPTITEHEAEQVQRANATGLAPVVFIHGAPRWRQTALRLHARARSSRG